MTDPHNADPKVGVEMLYGNVSMEDFKLFSPFMSSNVNLLQLLSDKLVAESEIRSDDGPSTLQMVERCAVALHGAASQVGLHDVQRLAKRLQVETKRVEVLALDQKLVVSLISKLVAVVELHIDKYTRRLSSPDRGRSGG